MPHRTIHATAIIDGPDGEYVVYCLSGCGEVASVTYVGRALAIRDLHSGKQEQSVTPTEKVAKVVHLAGADALLAS